MVGFEVLGKLVRVEESDLGKRSPPRCTIKPSISVGNWSKTLWEFKMGKPKKANHTLHSPKGERAEVNTSTSESHLKDMGKALTTSVTRM